MTIIRRVHTNMPSFTYSQTRSSRNAHTPTMIIPVESLPIPYIKPSFRESRKLKPYPPPVLPSRPEPVRWHYRNELQRRVSPTGGTFALSPTSPTFNGNTVALAVQPLRRMSQQQRPNTNQVEKNVYVLTLRMSGEIDGAMQELRSRWFPKERNKVPAHITLFHALPGSKMEEISDWLEGLSRRMRCFDVSTGRVLKRKTGVAVAVGDGAKEIKRVFACLRADWLEWLSVQDRSLSAHWTVQNKELDKERVEEAFRNVLQCEEVRGQATGLVLWRYKDDGTWSLEKEFGFADNGMIKEDSGAVQEIEDDNGKRS